MAVLEDDRLIRSVALEMGTSSSQSRRYLARIGYYRSNDIGHDFNDVTKSINSMIRVGIEDKTHPYGVQGVWDGNVLGDALILSQRTIIMQS